MLLVASISFFLKFYGQDLVQFVSCIFCKLFSRGNWSLSYKQLHARYKGSHIFEGISEVVRFCPNSDDSWHIHDLIFYKVNFGKGALDLLILVNFYFLLFFNDVLEALPKFF